MIIQNFKILIHINLFYDLKRCISSYLLPFQYSPPDTKNMIFLNRQLTNYVANILIVNYSKYPKIIPNFQYNYMLVKELPYPHHIEAHIHSIIYQNILDNRVLTQYISLNST